MDTVAVNPAFGAGGGYIHVDDDGKMNIWLYRELVFKKKKEVNL